MAQVSDTSLIPWPWKRVVAYKVMQEDEERLHGLRDRMESEGIIKEGRVLADRVWTWPEVSTCFFKGQRTPLCNRNWQSLHNLKDPRWGFATVDPKSGKQRQSITLDTLSLARLVARYFPSEWEYDGDPISRDQFMALQKQQEILKSVLLDALIDNAETEFNSEGTPDWHDDDKFDAFKYLLYQQATVFYETALSMVESIPDHYLERMKLQREVNLLMIEATRHDLSEKEIQERESRMRPMLDRLIEMSAES